MADKITRAIVLIGILALVGFVLLVGFVMLTEDDAYAAENCKYLPGDQCPGLVHYAPDDGYDRGIIVTCAWGAPAGDTSKAHLAQQWVQEGKEDTCVDMDGVKVRKDEEIWCKYPLEMGGYVWKKEFDAHGWHKVSYPDTYRFVGCTVRRD